MLTYQIKQLVFEILTLAIPTLFSLDNVGNLSDA